MATKLSHPRVVVVVPTYNEAKNIETALKAIFSRGQANHKYKLSVLVVDDNSPDGTASIAHTYSKRRTLPVEIITGQKKGLGEAYKNGFRYILQNKLADIVVMMDADLSHDAIEIPKLVSLIQKGNDLALGSRYQEGGMIPGNWPLSRIINSKVARFVSHYIGGIPHSVKDPAAGFRAFNAKHLRKVISNDYKNTAGYVFQISTVRVFVDKNLKIAETPIKFSDRKFGISKIRSRDIYEYFAFCFGVSNTSPLNRHLRIVAKLSLALLIFVIGTLSLQTISNSYFALIISAQLSLLFTYVLNRQIFSWLESYQYRQTRLSEIASPTLKLNIITALAIGAVAVVTDLRDSSLASSIVLSILLVVPVLIFYTIHLTDSNKKSV